MHKAETVNKWCFQTEYDREAISCKANGLSLLVITLPTREKTTNHVICVPLYSLCIGSRSLLLSLSHTISLALYPLLSIITHSCYIVNHLQTCITNLFYHSHACCMLFCTLLPHLFPFFTAILHTATPFFIVFNFYFHTSYWHPSLESSPESPPESPLESPSNSPIYSFFVSFSFCIFILNMFSPVSIILLLFFLCF